MKHHKIVDGDSNSTYEQHIHTAHTKPMSIFAIILIITHTEMYRVAGSGYFVSCQLWETGN